MHPLITNLGEMTDPQLDQKITELTRKYIIAQGLGNGHLQTQILVALNTYRDELIARTYKKQSARKEGDPDPFASLDIQ